MPSVRPLLGPSSSSSVAVAEPAAPTAERKGRKLRRKNPPPPALTTQHHTKLPSTSSSLVSLSRPGSSGTTKSRRSWFRRNSTESSKRPSEDLGPDPYEASTAHYRAPALGTVALNGGERGRQPDWTATSPRPERPRSRPAPIEDRFLSSPFTPAKKLPLRSEIAPDPPRADTSSPQIPPLRFNDGGSGALGIKATPDGVRSVTVDPSANSDATPRRPRRTDTDVTVSTTASTYVSVPERPPSPVWSFVPSEAPGHGEPSPPEEQPPPKPEPTPSPVHAITADQRIILPPSTATSATGSVSPERPPAPEPAQPPSRTNSVSSARSRSSFLGGWKLAMKNLTGSGGGDAPVGVGSGGGWIHRRKGSFSSPRPPSAERRRHTEYAREYREFRKKKAESAAATTTNGAGPSTQPTPPEPSTTRGRPARRATEIRVTPVDPEVASQEQEPDNATRGKSKERRSLMQKLRGEPKLRHKDRRIEKRVSAPAASPTTAAPTRAAPPPPQPTAAPAPANPPPQAARPSPLPPADSPQPEPDRTFTPTDYTATPRPVYLNSTVLSGKTTHLPATLPLPSVGTPSAVSPAPSPRPPPPPHLRSNDRRHTDSPLRHELGSTDSLPITKGKEVLRTPGIGSVPGGVVGRFPPPGAGVGAAAGKTAGAAAGLRPVAKLFVICCRCKYWHDLPSAMYTAMVENGGATRCPYCLHGMEVSCCSGYTCVVYMHQKHHPHEQPPPPPGAGGAPRSSSRVV